MRKPKISIVIPVLNSHEVLRRQLIYLERILVESDDVEIIIVDDGSIPALNPDFGTLNGRVIYTKDYRPWTWALARNRGAREAVGEWLLMFDVDHFVAPEIFDILRTYDGHKVVFKREFGVLTPDGEMTQNIPTLIAYGLPKERIEQKGLSLTALPNNFAMKKWVFDDIGGYREDFFHKDYPQGEDRFFKKAWCNWERANNGQYYSGRPKIYMFPNGYLCGDVDADKKGLFHKLSRKTKKNAHYQLGT